MERIKLIACYTFEYVPNFEGSTYYTERGISTINEAAKLDLEELRLGKVSAEELADDQVDVKYEVVVYDDGIDD